MISFLQSHTLFLTALHVFGVVIGFGGATLADILFFSFLKDFRINKKEASVMHIIAKVVLFALFLMLLTGIGLFLTNVPTYLQSPPFLLKLIAVIVLTANGFFLHSYLAPRLVRISLSSAHHKKLTSVEHHSVRRLNRIAFASGAVSFVSWYTTFFTAMLKSIMPRDLPTLLFLYAFLLLCGIIASQYIERFMTEKST